MCKYKLQEDGIVKQMKKKVESLTKELKALTQKTEKILKAARKA